MKTIIISISFVILSCGSTNMEHQKNAQTTENQNSEFKVTAESSSDKENGDQLIQVGNLITARATHTATTLKDGRVLICGGFAGNNQYFSSAEIYDPALNQFKQVGSMSTARISHTATLLPDGKVLIAGGFNGSYLSSTEIFDPETESFKPGINLSSPRMGHTATALPDGKILLAGGVGTGWTFLQSAEIFNIHSNTSEPTGSMAYTRESHTATMLQNGMVLITGGHTGRRSNMLIHTTAELYNPSTGKFSETGGLTVKRHKHDAVLLDNGNVLINGGSDERDYSGIYTSTEIYDAKSGTFKKSGNMNLARFKHQGSSILLNNGKVLLSGGSDRLETFNSKAGNFELISGRMNTKKYFPTVSRLENGDVLIVGGYDENINPSNQAWVYKSAK